MRKWMTLFLMMLMLTGCAAEETFETISDELIQPVSAQTREIVVTLPQEAATPVAEGDIGTIYLCDGYEIALQTLEGGDLNATIQTISGYSREDLTVMETEQGDVKKYELVWASAGELGDRVGRAVILDDGSYHYVLCVLSDADRTQEYQGVWQYMFDSFTVT